MRYISKARLDSLTNELFGAAASLTDSRGLQILHHPHAPLARALIKAALGVLTYDLVEEAGVSHIGYTEDSGYFSLNPHKDIP